MFSKMQSSAKSIFAPTLFLVAFLPRLIYPIARSTIWHERARLFMRQVANGSFHKTSMSPHPGVTTMWLVGIAQRIGDIFYDDYFEIPFVQKINIEIIPLALMIALMIVLAYFLLIRLFDMPSAMMISMLLALDPFHIYVSKTLHIDALMSVFVMVSGLYGLIFLRQSESRGKRPLILSAIFAGLALLTKVSSLFIVPFFLLCLGTWHLVQLGENGQLGTVKTWLWPTTLAVIRPFLLWLLILVVTYFLLFPAMWVSPLATIFVNFDKTAYHVANAHPNSMLFLGKTTLEDPGFLFYPVQIALKTTELILPAFFLGLTLLFSRRLERPLKMTLWMCVAFVFFFTLQMILGDKKDDRYILPTFEFIIIIAGVGLAYWLRWLTKQRKMIFLIAFMVLILIQGAISLPRHPYYGTHHNRLFGSIETILNNKIVSGQSQGEGLDIAATYLNEIPLAATLTVGVQDIPSFDRYFVGHAINISRKEVDYLVFSHNWIVRDLHLNLWEDRWEVYRDRQPKFVVEFDNVPYVWVYKAGPLIEEDKIPYLVDAQLGENFRLLGYDFAPAEAQPGETVHLTLYWETIQKTEENYTVFAHLLNENEILIGQKDSIPENGLYPTHLWDTGERVQDEYDLVISPDAAQGSYHFAIGMYTLETLTRLPVTDRDDNLLPDGRILIPGPFINSTTN